VSGRLQVLTDARDPAAAVRELLRALEAAP